jgi:hypothetical protein
VKVDKTDPQEVNTGDKGDGRTGEREKGKSKCLASLRAVAELMQS